MQTTLMKLIAQLESCKLVLDDIMKGEQTDEQNDKPPCLAPCEPICCDDCPFKGMTEEEAEEMMEAQR